MYILNIIIKEQLDEASRYGYEIKNWIPVTCKIFQCSCIIYKFKYVSGVISFVPPAGKSMRMALIFLKCSWDSLTMPSYHGIKPLCLNLIDLLELYDLRVILLIIYYFSVNMVSWFIWCFNSRKRYCLRKIGNYYYNVPVDDDIFLQKCYFVIFFL